MPREEPSFGFELPALCGQDRGTNREVGTEELGENGFFEKGGDLQIGGGGSVVLNLYYENITLFGSNPTYGMEEDRDAVAKMIESAYPEHEVSWYGPEPPDSSSEPPDSNSKE
ncbi:MAG: hypothetical protein E2P07_04895 [Acidobacteria bacterium]|nr:MAG: hypothetical protein E2P07_04895 [Acidobacteriota bacterium]